MKIELSLNMSDEEYISMQNELHVGNFDYFNMQINIQNKQIPVTAWRVVQHNQTVGKINGNQHTCIIVGEAEINNA